MSALPLCFVLMPFGVKPNGLGGLIDFDRVYDSLIKPAILQAGLEPLRADEERVGGMIHQAMFERLLLCDYAVADLSGANPNVFYELGIRHAMRPFSTVLIQAEGLRAPIDLNPVRFVPYHLDGHGHPNQVEIDGAALLNRLQACREALVDSPVYQLVHDLPTPEIKHLKTDLFRERLAGNGLWHDRLAQARQERPLEQARQRLFEIQESLGAMVDVDAGVVIDLYLSWRDVKGWEEMVALVERMSPPLARTVLVQEQLGFALNRMGQGERAERTLRELIRRSGPSSETLGLLGRVLKDRWEQAVNSDQLHQARGLLELAIDTYLKGFECDWRDAYPGINVLTLMEMRDPPDPRRLSLFGVVAYAVERRLSGPDPDYWDYATHLELAVLQRDRDQAEASLAKALAVTRASWELETTRRNLRLIRTGRERRGMHLGWDLAIEESLA